MAKTLLTEDEIALANQLGFNLDIVMVVKSAVARPFSDASALNNPCLDYESSRDELYEQVAILQRWTKKYSEVSEALDRLIEQHKKAILALDVLIEDCKTHSRMPLDPVKPGILFDMNSMKWIVMEGKLLKLIRDAGYGFTSRDKSCSKDFETRAAAAEFLAEADWPEARILFFKKDALSCSPTKENFCNLTFNGNEILSLNADGTCLVRHPDIYRVSALLDMVVLHKKRANTKKNKFQLVVDEGTCGNDFQIDTLEIIKHLKKWDKKYVVTVEDATVDSIDLRFQNLPEDMSDLCSELLSICPDLDYPLNEGEPEQNKKMLDTMANDIRRENCIQLWWD